MACRDGLIIALLALVPLRRGNLLSLAMGTCLIKNADQWTILITSKKSKNHDTLEYALPEMLVPHLQAYLEVHRPVLTKQVNRWKADTGNHLWVSSHGSPMTEMAIYDAIAKRTKAAFGTAINPHLFRDEAATALAIHDPAHVRSAAPLLGLRQLSTTERYYQQAQSLEAQREFAKQAGRMRDD
jgi:integrase/recombinase XerD